MVMKILYDKAADSKTQEKRKNPTVYLLHIINRQFLDRALLFEVETSSHNGLPYVNEPHRM